jgi:hypothetical protein
MRCEQPGAGLRNMSDSLVPPFRRSVVPPELGGVWWCSALPPFRRSVWVGRKCRVAA